MIEIGDYDIKLLESEKYRIGLEYLDLQNKNNSFMIKKYFLLCLVLKISENYNGKVNLIMYLVNKEFTLIESILEYNKSIKKIMK